MGAFDDLVLGFSMEVCFTLDPPLPVSLETRDEEDDDGCRRKQRSFVKNPILYHPLLLFGLPRQKTVSIEMIRGSVFDIIRVREMLASLFIETIGKWKWGLPIYLLA